MRDTGNRPLYSIGVVAELLDVHPETIRTWERSGLIRPPQRRSGKRTFSTIDLKRLEFIKRLATEGLSIRAIHYYLQLYPCWQTNECNGCACHSTENGYSKPCWLEPDLYCTVPSSKDLCIQCTKIKKPLPIL